MHYREATIEDIPAITRLYKRVSAVEGGIARYEDEITSEYITAFVKKSIDNGLIIVGEHPENASELIAEIHAYSPGLAVFKHIYTEMTFVVDPAFQGKRIGRTLLTIFLNEIASSKPEVGRVELYCRESNMRAITLYQSLGFRIEGRLEMRVQTKSRRYEADIPMGWQNPNFEF